MVKEKYKLKLSDFNPGLGWAKYIMRNNGNENAPEVIKRDNFLGYYQMAAITVITFLIGSGLEKLLSK